MRPPNGEHYLPEALSKWGPIFFSEIKAAFLMEEETQSGSWIVNRCSPGEDDTENTRSKSPEAQE